MLSRAENTSQATTIEETLMTKQEERKWKKNLQQMYKRVLAGETAFACWAAYYSAFLTAKYRKH